MTDRNLYSSGKAILSALLFDMRGYLTSIVGHMKILLENPTTLAPTTWAWLLRLKPMTEKWWLIQAQAKRLCCNSFSSEPYWETIIAQLGGDFSDVDDAYGEAQQILASLDVPVSADISAIVRSLENLCEHRRLIVTEEYKRYWGKYANNAV